MRSQVCPRLTFKNSKLNNKTRSNEFLSPPTCKKKKKKNFQRIKIDQSLPTMQRRLKTQTRDNNDDEFILGLDTSFKTSVDQRDQYCICTFGEKKKCLNGFLSVHCRLQKKRERETEKN